MTVRAEASLDSHAVVLMYHRFGQTSAPSTNITMQQFRAHLDYLEVHRYSVWPLSRIVEHIQSGRPIPDKTVAITIDDAHISVFNHAWPELSRRGMPFTVFVSTKRIDEGAESLMSWVHMQGMKKQGGVEFGNHSLSHAHLIERKNGESEAAWADRVGYEIDKNQQRLDDELGANPRLFAYPYGEYSQDLQKIVAGKGYVSFGQHSGVISAWSDRQALPRYPMNERYALMSEFIVKIDTLPFALKPASYEDPVLKKGQAIKFVMAADRDALKNVRCYASESRDHIVRQIDEATIVIRLGVGFSQRRGRVNCTMLDPVSGRFRWHSQLWIQPWLAETESW